MRITTLFAVLISFLFVGCGASTPIVSGSDPVVSSTGDLHEEDYSDSYSEFHDNANQLKFVMFDRALDAANGRHDLSLSQLRSFHKQLNLIQPHVDDAALAVRINEYLHSYVYVLIDLMSSFQFAHQHLRNQITELKSVWIQDREKYATSSASKEMFESVDGMLDALMKSDRLIDNLSRASDKEIPGLIKGLCVFARRSAIDIPTCPKK